MASIARFGPTKEEAMTTLQDQMKQAVALAAVDQISSGMVLGLGSGSTAA